jgi:hypothetical protein
MEVVGALLLLAAARVVWVALHRVPRIPPPDGPVRPGHSLGREAGRLSAGAAGSPAGYRQTTLPDARVTHGAALELDGRVSPSTYLWGAWVTLAAVVLSSVAVTNTRLTELLWAAIFAVVGAAFTVAGRIARRARWRVNLDGATLRIESVTARFVKVVVQIDVAEGVHLSVAPPVVPGSIDLQVVIASGVQRRLWRPRLRVGLAVTSLAEFLRARNVPVVEPADIPLGYRPISPLGR